jgi:predicted PhzF superfamily epimerase YddE/YHI9
VREISAAQSAELAAALGIAAQRVRARATVDVGVVWVTLQLADADTVRAAEGRCMGRDGRVEVRYADNGTIWLCGHAVTCVQGMLIASLHGS